MTITYDANGVKMLYRAKRYNEATQLAKQIILHRGIENSQQEILLLAKGNYVKGNLIEAQYWIAKFNSDETEKMELEEQIKNRMRMLLAS